MSGDGRHHVVIAGGGVAGLEALIALRRLAGDTVRVTLLAPTGEFVLRALSVQDPFARPTPRRYRLARICADHDAEFVRDALQAVDAPSRTIATVAGRTLGYDSLLVAVGARAEPAFAGALTFRGLQDAEAMHGLVQDVEAGAVTRIAFVVPPGATWPLPLYELALMTAERAHAMSVDAGLTIVTCERAPLAVFGRVASERVDALLAERGIVVRTECEVASVDRGDVAGAAGHVEVRAQRVVALPVLSGPAVRGLPGDGDGFVAVDDLGRVAGLDGVHAAGDGTTAPVKQGGIAAQQALAAATAIARRAGADVPLRPFRPVLRAELLTGSRSTYLREHLAGDDGDHGSTTSDHALWWPPTKVAAPHLAPYLEGLDRGEPRVLHATGDPARGMAAPVE
jgi:sulfide:quinone oxidoreductase